MNLWNYEYRTAGTGDNAGCDGMWVVFENNTSGRIFEDDRIGWLRKSAVNIVFGKELSLFFKIACLTHTPINCGLKEEEAFSFKILLKRESSLYLLNKCTHILHSSNNDTVNVRLQITNFSYVVKNIHFLLNIKIDFPHFALAASTNNGLISFRRVS